MRDIYSLHRVAHVEYEQRMQSIPAVSEYDFSAKAEQSRWSSLLRTILRAVWPTSPHNELSTIRPSLSLSNPSPFLRAQLREDSNCELDWLWAASQVTAPEEIRYCLERALYINPNNGNTQSMLSKLIVRCDATNETVQLIGQDLAQSF